MAAVENTHAAHWHTHTPYLVDVTLIVVHVEYAVQFRVTAHSQLTLSAQTSCTIPGMNRRTHDLDSAIIIKSMLLIEFFF